MGTGSLRDVSLYKMAKTASCPKVSSTVIYHSPPEPHQAGHGLVPSSPWCGSPCSVLFPVLTPTLQRGSRILLKPSHHENIPASSQNPERHDVTAPWSHRKDRPAL